METARTVATGFALAIGFAILLAWAYSRAQARERDAAATTAAGDLHGLASVVLPRRYRSLGMVGADESLTTAEQLARHDESKALIFQFTKDPKNDWGGHKRDPELLNIVFLPPATRANPSEALQRFSIDRYYSPMGDAVPLDSPRWQLGSDDRYRWRVLAQDDHFGVDHAPRWAIAMLDPVRGVRLDLYVWRKRMKQDNALAMLRGILDGLEIRPSLAEHFAQTGGVQARLERMREENLRGVFVALEPFGLQRPTPGETAFGRGVAAWLDEERRAVRVMRVLASVPLEHGIAKANTDSHGRPILPLSLKPGQYPGSTRDGLPALYLQMLYFNPAHDRWQRSFLQYATGDEEHPLLPGEEALAAKLDTAPGGRDVVHVLLSRHWFHPPALDDAREIGAFLEDCEKWEKELRAGRIIVGEVREATLR